MSEINERVAKAIREHVKCDATGLAPAVASVYLVGFEKAARAAVEAMREPTLEMVKAYIAADPRRKRFAASAKRDFRAMIDAALSPPLTEDHP